MREDTIHLLGDCTAKIGLTAKTINGLLPGIKDRSLRQKLQAGLQDRQQLRSRACTLLARYGADERSPGAIARGMSWLRTNARMALNADDTTAALLVAGDCDLGVRSLCKSQNQYCMANADALTLSQDLIQCEERLSAALRPYL